MVCCTCMGDAIVCAALTFVYFLAPLPTRHTAVISSETNYAAIDSDSRTSHLGVYVDHTLALSSSHQSRLFPSPFRVNSIKSYAGSVPAAITIVQICTWIALTRARRLHFIGFNVIVTCLHAKTNGDRAYKSRTKYF